MKPRLLDGPRCSTIPTDTEPNRRRRDHDVGMNRVRTDLVDVTVDVDRGLPGDTAISRPRDTPDVNVGEEHSAI
jgi:hypothetical protein